MSEGVNPFEPPKADWAVEAPGLDAGFHMDASSGARFANLLLDQIGRFLFGTAAAVVVPDNIGVVLFMMVGYYVAFEYLWGRTPAKWITGTRVVTFDGGKPRFWQIVGRTFARYVPFEPFSFLGNSGGWHDRWSNTRVIRVR